MRFNVAICAEEDNSAHASQFFNTAGGVNQRTSFIVSNTTATSSICPTMGIKLGMSWIGLRT
jgi:hypothetical protein